MGFIEIGAVVKPQGIKGELKVKPLTGEIAAFEDLKTVYLKEKADFAPYTVAHVRADREFAYILLKGVGDRNEAETLRNRMLFVKKEDLPLPEGTHYIADLIGMGVFDEQGNSLGTIKDIIVTGAADVYVVASQCGGFMFPALKRVILHTDAKAKRMTLDAKALSEVAVYEV